MTELERLRASHDPGPANGPTLLLEAAQLKAPAQCLARLREVMEGVLAVPAPLWEEGQEEAWVAYLPAWFVESMRRYPVAEIIARPEQWDFASWVATVAAREWAW
jgi:intergrase/recombinase